MSFTTNSEDQKAAADMQARLRENRHQRSSLVGERLSSVHVDEGAHKYVLIRAHIDGDEQYFVTSKCGASYHRDAAEPMIGRLEEAGYYDIEVTGGGRISYNEQEKKMSIFGFSYGFGRADHSISQRVVEADSAFQGVAVDISNDGY